MEMSFLAQLVLVLALVLQGGCEVYQPDEDKLVMLYSEPQLAGNETGPFYYHQASVEGPVASVQQQGVWVYYSEEGYTGDVTAVLGEEFSFDLAHPLRSFRYAGSSLGSTSPAVILYEHTWFRGQEYPIELVDDGDLVIVPNFRDMSTNAKSLIMVGADFTFFPEQNLGGTSCWCVRPTHFAMTYGVEDGYEMLMAAFVPDLDDTTIAGPSVNSTTVGSVILGCQTPMRHHCHRTRRDNRRKCSMVSNVKYDTCLEE